MGTALTYCTGGGTEREKLEKAEKENEELKRQLVEAQEKYVKKQQQIEQLYTEKTKTTTDLLVQKKEKEKLLHKYSNIEDKNTQLSKENRKLKKELSVSITQKEQKQEKAQEDKTIINDRESEEEPVQEQQQQQEESKAKESEEDEGASPRTDIVQLRNWLIYKNFKEKELKTELAKLLTARNESHRSKIPQAYKQRYGADIMDDINKIIGKRTNAYELVDGLFKTRSEYDAICIKEMHSALDIGEIIFCRNINELQLISHEYKRLYGVDVKDKICKMSSKKTYQIMINSIFTFSRNDNETTNKIKIAAKVTGDVEHLMDKNVKWKNFNNKQKLALMIVANNKNYIRDLNDKYFEQSQENLTDFIDNVLGERSTSAQLMKIRIEYAADSYDFYARRIQVLGDDYWKNTKEINRIFISTFGNELKHIKKKFNQLNYGDGKSMIKWLNKACKHDRYAFFLTKMLEKCAKRS